MHSSLLPHRRTHTSELVPRNNVIHIGSIIVKPVESRRCEALTTEDLRLDPVRQDGAALVTHVPPGWDGEDVVQFCSRISSVWEQQERTIQVLNTFKRSLLRLWHPQKYHDEGYGVHSGIESEGSSDSKCTELTREG